MPGWNVDDLPAQVGRTALVTGANGGLGRQVARGLATRGARVLLACRDEAAGAATAAWLRAEVPGAAVEPVRLDLADLDDVAALARDLGGRLDGLDVLVNNAGVMAVPRRRTTAQGFELQLGVNHLGHVALTAGLLPLLRSRPGARVVTVTSGLHHRGQLALDDLQSERRYRPWTAYAQSKLANVLFAVELDRRARAAGWDLLSVAAHPGLSRTGLARSGPLLGGLGPTAAVVLAATTVFGQSASRGAQPLLHAALAPGVQGGRCYGPAGPFELRGRPVEVAPSRWALDEQLGDWSWRRAEADAGVGFGALSVP